MNSLLNKAWKLKTAHSNLPLIQRVTQQRDLSIANELKELHSPWSMKDMDKAVERIQKSIKKEERIMIFGDYDVDGISGTCILYLTLKELGAKVSVRLPHRERDGYGLNTKVVDECKKLGVSLLITVDCGISNVKEVEYGHKLGLDIIITDHHSIPLKIPKALAILNPKQEDCKYPDKTIVGTVVALKLGTALQEQSKLSKTSTPPSKNNLDIAALATVADCAPLKGENRLIVKQGLLQFQQTKHRGLRKLLESYQLTNRQNTITKKPISSYHLGFNIAPCINAAGRLDDPMIAFQMMIGDTDKAIELRQINEARQEIVKTSFIEASKLVEKYHKDDPILIFWDDKWKPGIIGLLAGKLCEQYYRPVICLTKSDDKYVGSCRSIPEINIVEYLQQNEDLFLNYGGHAMAAGLSIEPSKREELKKRLNSSIGSWMKKNYIEPHINIDTEISVNEITLETETQLTQLEPFGIGNPKPKFLLKNMNIIEARIVGKDHSHLQLKLEKNDRILKGIAFQMAKHKETILKWRNIDLVCQLNRNEFRGSVSVDIQMVDAKKTK